jgi:AraC family transcriptional activator of tynA and feaB
MNSALYALETWHAALEDVYGTVAIDAADVPSFQGNFSRNGSSALPCGVIGSNVQRVRQIVEPHSGAGSGHVYLVANLAGSAVLKCGEHSLAFGPGDCTLVDPGMAWDFQFRDPFQHLSVHLPRSILYLHPDGPAASVLYLFSARNFLTRSLLMLSKLVVGERQQCGIVAELSLRDSLISLISGALAAGREDPTQGPSAAARRAFARAQAVIERGLTDPDLGPADIARQAGMSLRSLHRLFYQHDESVCSYILSRRLQRAYQMLISSSARRRTVTEVAFHWGFKDLGHFSRAFHRKFRRSPSDVLARGR